MWSGFNKNKNNQITDVWCIENQEYNLRYRKSKSI